MGRIIFEAIEYNVPSLCYSTGGCGELANLLGFSKNTIDTATKTINKLKIEEYLLNFNKSTMDFEDVKKIIREKFSRKNYAKQIEKYL